MSLGCLQKFEENTPLPSIIPRNNITFNIYTKNPKKSTSMPVVFFFYLIFGEEKTNLVFSLAGNDGCETTYIDRYLTFKRTLMIVQICEYENLTS